MLKARLLLNTTTIYVTPDDQPVRKIPIVINPRIAGGRVVLYGGGFPDITKRMRLRIIYSKI